MVFTTLPFIAFFAFVFFVYYAVPKGWQWKLLLAASWFFYAYASPYYLIFLAITALTTYGGAVWMDASLARQKAWLKGPGKGLARDEKKQYKERQANSRRWMLIGVIVTLMGMLGVFKYLSFLVENVAWMGGALGFHIQSPTLNLLLPIGLSFYIFQSMGYCIDVAREMVPAERNIFKHALFVSYFPQLLQGPIGSYERLAPQLFEEHRFDVLHIDCGLGRICLGVFKKLIIANYIAATINSYWAQVDQHGGCALWFVVCVLYAVQLYADFSGYVDIACGCSQMFGIKLEENFKLPYFSKTIAEFWRNWHITLGVWFKNYVFYPLLMSDSLSSLRKRYAHNSYLSNALPNVSALLIVWFLIGLWHGADWAFVIYGLFHGFFVILGVLLQPAYESIHSKYSKICKSKPYAVFQILRTFIIVTIGYALFKPADISKTCSIVKECVSGWGLMGAIDLIHRLPTVCLWATGALFLFEGIQYGTGVSLRRLLNKVPLVMRFVCYMLFAALVVWCGLNTTEVRQFEYFKF